MTRRVWANARDYQGSIVIALSISDRCRYALDDRSRVGEQFDFIQRESLKRGSETLYPTPSAFLQQPSPSCSGFQPHGPGICGINTAFHQPRDFQSSNGLCHRWRFHLLDQRKIRQPHRASEYEYRQRGQSRRPYPGALILFPDTS